MCPPAGARRRGSSPRRWAATSSAWGDTCTTPACRCGRRLFGVSGEGLRLKNGHRYRVVGTYDNPTGKLIKMGAMAHMVGLFVPDDYARWPKLDLTAETRQEDLAALNE